MLNSLNGLISTFSFFKKDNEAVIGIEQSVQELKLKPPTTILSADESAGYRIMIYHLNSVFDTLTSY